MFYEPLSYPVRVAKKFDFITYSKADEFEVGQIFQYESDNVVHMAWRESGCFENIPNEDCKFRILQPGICDTHIDDLVDFKDLTESRIDDWVLAGIIKKIYIEPKEAEAELVDKTEQIVKTTKKQKQVKPSYSDISKKLGLKLDEFKKKYSEVFNKEIKDARSKVSKPTAKKIIEALST